LEEALNLSSDRILNDEDALFCIFFRVIYPLHVSNRVTIHDQEAVTVYAAYYGIYHAFALTSC
jgi:drug/metabolite transporter superfamily protein YnfA